MMQLDPSTSSISNPINLIPSEHPSQVEVKVINITYMDRDLLKAAQHGDMELFNKYQGDLHCLVDGRQNTALHIYSRIVGRRGFFNFQIRRSERFFSIEFVEQLVNKCPSLLLQPNVKGEVPLHIAARHGHSDMVKFLIERAKVVQQEDPENGLEATCRLKQMLRMTDKDGNTALHKAVESGDYLDVVRLLVKELDPDFSFSANKSGETPLYIAAMTKRSRLVAEILDNWKSTDYGGPDGRTALHAAVIANDQKSVNKLIEANMHLIKETDDNGRTPLHYAALYGCRSIAKLLLESDASAAYITDKVGGMTALHMAVWRDRKCIMEDIISCCPGCCEIVDKRGWNFLHLAVAILEPKKLCKFLYWNFKIIQDLPIRDLVDEKDVNGNTPLHVLIFRPACRQLFQSSIVAGVLGSSRSEDYVYLYSSSETKKKQIEEALEDLRNNAKVARLPVPYTFKKHVWGDFSLENIGDKARESHLLVATLIATVTFTAAFTAPGGYKSDEHGAPTLLRDTAFQFFITSNSLAFVASVFAIFIYFMSVLVQGNSRYYLEPALVKRADMFTLMAMIWMVLAFSTGTYAMLQSLSGFAIQTLCIGLAFYPASIVWQLFGL